MQHVVSSILSTVLWCVSVCVYEDCQRESLKPIASRLISFHPEFALEHGGGGEGELLNAVKSIIHWPETIIDLF